jgi:transcriptional regulator with XRE-family HTH domain
MKSFKEILKEELRDPEFAREYEEVSAEMDFALRLALRREQLGLTQQTLAEETGIKQPMIARIEHGQMPTAPTIQRLAKALKINIIFTGHGILIEPLAVHTRSKPHEMKNLTQVYVAREKVDFPSKRDLSGNTTPFTGSEIKTLQVAYK